METFLVAFAAMAIFFILMSVGMFLGRAPIKGSCGGMSSLGMEVACDICGGDQEICDTQEGNESVAPKNTDLSYEASSK